jgi:hypothetical protein
VLLDVGHRLVGSGPERLLVLPTAGTAGELADGAIS